MAVQKDHVPGGGAVAGAGPSAWWAATAGLSAALACALLVVYLWTDPSSPLLLIGSGLWSLASAAVSFSLLRTRPRRRNPGPRR